MKKKDIIHEYRKRAKCTFPVARQAVDTFIDILVDGLCADGYLLIPNIFSVIIRDTPQKVGQNISKGEPVVIPARQRLTIKPGAALKYRLDNNQLEVYKNGCS